MSSQKLLSKTQFKPRFLSSKDVISSITEYIADKETDLTAREVIESVDVPESEDKRRIDLARRVLLAGGNRTGYSHPVDVQCSLRRCDAVPQRMTRKLGINEIRFGRFRGETADRVEKASAVLDWAGLHIDDGVLEDIEQAQFDDIENECNKKIEKRDEQLEVEAFIDQTPETVFGAKQVKSESPANIEIAYKTSYVDERVVVGVGRRSDGTLIAAEWLADDFFGADQNPLDVSYNRLLSLDEGAFSTYKSIYEHLKRSN